MTAAKVDAAKVNGPKVDPKVDPNVDIDRLFHALGDPTRRAMLDRLCESPRSVSNLAGPLGITLTAVMQHLQILEECGLAHTEKVGRVRTCQIASAGLDALEQWVRAHRTQLERQLDRLANYLAEDDPAE